MASSSPCSQASTCGAECARPCGGLGRRQRAALRLVAAGARGGGRRALAARRLGGRRAAGERAPRGGQRAAHAVQRSLLLRQLPAQLQHLPGTGTEARRPCCPLCRDTLWGAGGFLGVARRAGPRRTACHGRPARPLQPAARRGGGSCQQAGQARGCGRTPRVSSWCRVRRSRVTVASAASAGERTAPPGKPTGRVAGSGVIRSRRTQKAAAVCYAAWRPSRAQLDCCTEGWQLEALGSSSGEATGARAPPAHGAPRWPRAALPRAAARCPPQPPPPPSRAPGAPRQPARARVLGGRAAALLSASAGPVLQRGAPPPRSKLSTAPWHRARRQSLAAAAVRGLHARCRGRPLSGTWPPSVAIFYPDGWQAACT